MSAPRRAGRRTGPRTQPPPERLSSRALFSHRATRSGPDEVASWNERNHALLSLYGLEVASVVRLPLVDGGRGRPGPLQTEHRDRLLLAGVLGALAVSASGRGDLLATPPAERAARKREAKENNDRNSTAAMTEALHALCEATPGTVLRIAIGEGARLKPGEKGGNPTLYAGQVISSGGSEAAGGSGQGRRYALAVDTVEGTTKSTLFDPSCGTLLYVTESTIAEVPDVYFDKCQLKGIDQVTVADPLERIVEAVMDARGTSEVNLFALDRARHPIDRMVEMGASMRVDTDGDAYPAVAAGLVWGVYPDNLRPLDGVCGNIGGAAEMIASAAGASYLGVRSTARFCAGAIDSWDKRYDFAAGEREVIRGRGLDPDKVYAIQDLVPGLDSADGALVAAAISDNWHVPGMDAAFVGGNFAEVSALFVGSAGYADLYRIVFAYRGGLEPTRAALTPVLTRLLGLPASDIAGAVRAAVADPNQARRLQHEIATSFYMHMAESPAGGQMRLDLDSAARVESERAIAFLRAVTDAAPDWFA